MSTSITAPAHTSGPWLVAPTPSAMANWIIQLEDGSFIAGVGEGSSEGYPEQTEANARLIAAAPDLAKALEAVLDVLLDGRTDDLTEKEEQAVDLANAALEKAY